MITALELNNFKSWAATGRVELRPLTGLFGTNSSGKTSLLQALLMLKQTADSPDRNVVLHLGDDKALLELGTFQDILYRHEEERSLKLRLDWRMREELEVSDPFRSEPLLLRSHELTFEVEVRWQKNGGQSGGRAVPARMAYGFASASFGMEPEDEGSKAFKLVNTHPKLRFRRARGRPSTLPQPTKCYGFPDQVRASFQNAEFLSDFELEFEKLFARLFYLGPLREYPRRQYAWGGAHPSDMGRRGERVVEALLASREAGVRYSLGKGKKRQSLEEIVAGWLKRLGLIESFEVRPIAEGSKLFQVWVRRQPEANEVLLTDVGFGVSQILPVIALCYYVPEGSVVLLEQPEIHLHPSVQAGLADVFMDAARTRGIQIMVESHSEHLLRRMQLRIAQEKFSEQDAALYFCTNERGESRLTRLQLDAFGHISNWPPDFFGDEFGEITAMQRAILDRKASHPR